MTNDSLKEWIKQKELADGKQLKDPCEHCREMSGYDCLAGAKCSDKLDYERLKPLADEKVDLDDLADAIEYASVRTHDILVIKSRRSFDVKSDDDSKVELNEGYEFETNAPIPEIADGIAKMAIEMDKMTELGEDAGTMFLTLIAEFYKKLKGGE